MANSPQHRSDSVVTTLAERIVREARDVRRRIRELTLRAYRERGLNIDGLAPLVEEILLGVVSGLAGVGRSRRDELLRLVFEGLADAYAATAEHSRRAQRWEEIEARIKATASEFTSRAGEDIMNEFRTVADQFRQAGQKLKPKAKAAIHAIDENVVEPASHAANEGAKRVRRTLGVLLAAAGEMIHDLGDTIKDARESEVPASRRTRSQPAAAKASKARPARAASRPTKAAPSKARSAKASPAATKRAAQSKTANRSAKPARSRSNARKTK